MFIFLMNPPLDFPRRIPSTSSRSFGPWRITRLLSSRFISRARRSFRCFIRRSSSTKEGAWSFLERRRRCCVILPRRNININLGLTWALVLPVEPPGRSSFSMYWRRRCETSAVTSSMRRIAVGSWWRLGVIHQNFGGTNMKRFD